MTQYIIFSKLIWSNRCVDLFDQINLEKIIYWVINIIIFQLFYIDMYLGLAICQIKINIQ